jgi:hypothetical protein
LEGAEIFPTVAGSKGDDGGEVKGEEIGEGCKGVVGLAEYSGVAELRENGGGGREVWETCLEEAEIAGEEGDPALDVEADDFGDM